MVLLILLFCSSGKSFFVIIEGGSKTLQSFIDKNIWDEARIFTTNKELTDGVKSPDIKGEIIEETEVGGDSLEVIIND